MTDFPANWQMRDLFEAIGTSGLDPDGFLFGTGGSRHGSRVPAFHFGHKEYESAGFFVEYFEVNDPTGYYGVPRGHYHVDMTPSREGMDARFNQVPWEEVVSRFGEWISYLRREFEATAELAASVPLPRLSPPSPPGDDPFSEAEIELIEPILIQAEADFIEVVEEEFATRDDLDDLRSWVSAELADVRAELKRQSKRGFRRSAYGMAANLGMKLGPEVWAKVVPIVERVMAALDNLPQLPPGG